MNNYELLKLPINATQREIYSAFSNLFDYGKSFEEQLNLIDAFIVLSDINLRKRYDETLQLGFLDDAPQYCYSYFSNGEICFDINGNFAGNAELTEFINARKNSEIRSSDDIDSYYSETEIYSEFAKIKLVNMPLEAEKYDVTNMNDLERLEVFKKIYNKYKNGFLFSQEFVPLISTKNFNNLDITQATEIATQKLLNYKRGVCTHFAALIYQELKKLGIEAYYVRMMLPHWYHHVVLYRINEKWFIADLTNEYLFGEAGYKISDNSYGSIALESFIENNERTIGNVYLPKYFGETIIDGNVTYLTEFIMERIKKGR